MKTLHRDSPTILVVEEDPRMNAFLVAVLVAAGYRVFTTDGCLSALAILDAGEMPRVDLLLTEGRTALFRGTDFARWIRLNRPGVQCVIISDTEPEVKTSDCKWLRKPFDQTTLIGVVNELLTPLVAAA